MSDMRERVHWLAMHGVIRASATILARRGDPQGRLISDPAIRADPLPFYDELRALRQPIIRCRLACLTVDYATAHEILRSEDFGVVSLGSKLPAPLRRLEQRTRPGGLHPLLPPSLLSVEPPDHTRYRKTVSSVFTTRAIAALRDRVGQTAEELLDGLAAAGQRADVVTSYCAQLPVAIISEILGVPARDRAKVLEFGEMAAPSLDIGLRWPQYRSVSRGLTGFNAWLARHLEQLRRNPGDDLMSQLIQAGEGAGDRPVLSDLELHAIAGLVLAAGFETTVNLLGNGIRMLMDAPDQLALLRENPDLWAGAVEEILRLDSPVQLSARTAVTDTVVAGCQVHAGDTVIICLAAANRDPAVFAEPDRFDVTRPNAGRHLAFSGGRHFCLGAALARVEGEVGLRSFFERFPDAVPAGPGVRRDTRVLRGWSTLPVLLGPTRAVVS